MKKKILVITDAYPFSNGETFLESELNIWNSKSNYQVSVLPLERNGSPRKLPENISLAPSYKKKGVFNLFQFLNIFLQEITYLILHRLFDHKTAYIALNESIELTHHATLIRQINDANNYDLIYSYWNDKASYAASLVSAKTVCRAHRYDLYKEQKYKNYMPLKSQFANKFKRIFLITESAKKYYVQNYKAQPEIIAISRLGVANEWLNSNKLTQKEQKNPNEFHIVSVSFMVEVKRIDMIIETIFNFKKLRQDLKIRWTHIGDGPLRENLETLAESKLQRCEYEFKGQMENKDILRFYQEHHVDLFINLSSSEGVPVALMEAMSQSIPCVATDVGGTSDLVDEESGLLLEPNICPKDVAYNIDDFILSRKINSAGNSAALKIKEFYSATRNFNNFINEISVILRDE